jgi:hypothetical protein
MISSGFFGFGALQHCRLKTPKLKRGHIGTRKKIIVPFFFFFFFFNVL